MVEFQTNATLPCAHKKEICEPSARGQIGPALCSNFITAGRSCGPGVFWHKQNASCDSVGHWPRQDWVQRDRSVWNSGRHFRRRYVYKLADTPRDSWASSSRNSHWCGDWTHDLDQNLLYGGNFKLGKENGTSKCDGTLSRLYQTSSSCFQKQFIS